MDFSFLNKSQVSFDKLVCEKYGRDRTNLLHSFPKAILFPKSTLDVSNILKYCNNNKIAVIPSSGRTGLSGATLALQNEIIISMEMMNRIIKIDTDGATVELEAGVILEDIQNEVDKHQLCFPLDFAAKGSCLIGGCISTNAGGVKVLQYGMTRDIVLGLEIVKADGTVLDLNKALIKDNSGYDLKQLFIGAEGTLGIITKATLKCVAKANNPTQIVIAVSDFSNIPKIFQNVKKYGFELFAFEFMTEICVNAVRAAMPQLRLPFQDTYPFLVLIEVENDENKIENVIESLACINLIEDAVISKNSKMSHDFWILREAISDSLYLMGNIYANDVSVPIKSISTFFRNLDYLINESNLDFTLALFGHVGDGNFHIYLIDEEGKKSPKIEKKREALNIEIFLLVQKFKGSISAEHGIGFHKKNILHYRRSSSEVMYMQHIKHLFDPNNILNPNKIF